MNEYEIEQMIIEVQDAMVVTNSKVGTWQISVLKTILKALLYILIDMKDKIK